MAPQACQSYRTFGHVQCGPLSYHLGYFGCHYVGYFFFVKLILLVNITTKVISVITSLCCHSNTQVVNIERTADEITVVVLTSKFITTETKLPQKDTSHCFLLLLMVDLERLLFVLSVAQAHLAENQSKKKKKKKKNAASHPLTQTQEKKSWPVRFLFFLLESWPPEILVFSNPFFPLLSSPLLIPGSNSVVVYQWPGSLVSGRRLFGHYYYFSVLFSLGVRCSSVCCIVM